MPDSLQIPFINIHTHHTKDSDQLISIKNLFTDDIDAHLSSSGFYSIGIHPWHIHQTNYVEHLEKIRQTATHSNVLAIGEIGLDKTTSVPFELQLECLQQQLDLAKEFNKPVIIHCVRAFNELITIRKKNPDQPWIIHGFHGKEILMLQLIELNCFISFGSNLCKPCSNSTENIKFVSLDSIFFETDDSDYNIENIYKTAASYRQQDIQTIKSEIYKNYLKIFKK